jgi:hypothetical protein
MGPGGGSSCTLTARRRRCIVRVGSGEGRMGPGGGIVLHPYSQTSALQLGAGGVREGTCGVRGGDRLAPL